MIRKSPHTVQYKDLVALAEGLEKEASRKLAGARTNGVSNLNGLTHHHEMTKMLVRLLKKCQPGKQADMFELFEILNK